MARCEVCGNDYDKAFSIRANGQEHVFDSFECAIQALAPQCAHCHCRIIGHGVEGAGDLEAARQIAQIAPNTAMFLYTMHNSEQLSG